VRRAEESREPFDAELVLFVDESEESRQAREALLDAGEEFRTIRASGPRIPAAVFGGVVAERLAGIRGLLQALAAFATTFESERAKMSAARSYPAPRQR